MHTQLSISQTASVVNEIFKFFFSFLEFFSFLRSHKFTNDKYQRILYNKSVTKICSNIAKEDAMEKNKKNFVLGIKAQRVLTRALPFMIFPALLLTVFFAAADGTTLISERESILLYLETLSRLAVCLSLGTVLADYAERKTKSEG